MTVAAVGTARAEGPPQDPPVQATELTKVALHINGRREEVLVESRWSLSYVLREQLGLTGTKIGCERGECGACTVLIDDVPRYSCMTLAVEADGKRVTTVEGLMHGEDLGPTQQAFLEEDAFQCGYCTSGQIMAVEGMLAAHPDPTLDEVRVGVSGNLCRCGAYAHIFKAAQRAAALKREAGGAS
jgi:xanthine dehydrogenase YagT iron-sulfur-binding subunit